MFLRRADIDSGDSTSDNYTGNGILRLFPQSRFPFELFAEKSDSRTDTDLTGLTIDRTRYGVNQSYISEGGASMSVGYERSDQTNITTDTRSGERLREDVSDCSKPGTTMPGARTVLHSMPMQTLWISPTVWISTIPCLQPCVMPTGPLRLFLRKIC